MMLAANHHRNSLRHKAAACRTGRGRDRRSVCRRAVFCRTPSAVARRPNTRTFSFLGFMPLASPRAIGHRVRGIQTATSEHRRNSAVNRYFSDNVWATWCGPCRKEMPALDRLQAKLGSDDFVRLRSRSIAVAWRRSRASTMKSTFGHLAFMSIPRRMLRPSSASSASRQRCSSTARARSRPLHGPRRLGRSECRRNDPALSAAAQTALP